MFLYFLLIAIIVKFNESTAFDQTLRAHVPLLFDEPQATQVTRLDKLFLKSIYWDPTFTNDLKVEIDGYNLSLVSLPFSTSVIAGATWVGVLLKMIQSVKKQVSSPQSWSDNHVDSNEGSQSQPSSQNEAADGDIEMDIVEQESVFPPSPVQPLPSSLSQSKSPIYGDGNPAKTRQAWHYAVLFRASTHPFPGTLTLKKNSDIVVTSEDVAKYFPLGDRLLIGKDEFFAKNFDPKTMQLQLGKATTGCLDNAGVVMMTNWIFILLLDRPFEGSDAANVKAYVSGSSSTLHPPFIKAKQILEREPGNKYEDQNSDEQELFQDYQFLKPESDYEVAVKLGPVTTAKDARVLAEEWRKQCRDHFEAKKCVLVTLLVSLVIRLWVLMVHTDVPLLTCRCISGLKSCDHYCPQRSGHSLVSPSGNVENHDNRGFAITMGNTLTHVLVFPFYSQCCETMAAVGKEIAKLRFGRVTFSRALKPRASLQKFQDRFKGTDPWPGSPSSALCQEGTPASNGGSSQSECGGLPDGSKASRALDF